MNRPYDEPKECNAKTILRRSFGYAQDDRGCRKLAIINYQLSIVNFEAPVWGRQIRKKYLPFLGRGEKCRRGAAFRDFQKMKMGKKWEDFSGKVWYNSSVESGSWQLTINNLELENPSPGGKVPRRGG